MKSGRNEKKITKVCRSDSELRREEREEGSPTPP